MALGQHLNRERAFKRQSGDLGWREFCSETKGMRTLSICLILILFSSFFGQAQAAKAVPLPPVQPAPMVIEGHDDNLHAGLSYNLTAATSVGLQRAGYSTSKAALISGGMVFLLGLFKEFAIDRRPQIDDLQADLVGTATGMIIPYRIEF